MMDLDLSAEQATLERPVDVLLARHGHRGPMTLPSSRRRLSRRRT